MGRHVVVGQGLPALLFLGQMIGGEVGASASLAAARSRFCAASSRIASTAVPAGMGRFHHAEKTNV
jgi:hypothetical protein